MESYCRSQQEQMPNRNGVLTARFDKFWLQCHSKQAAVITHPPPPSHPSQIRTHSRSNPTFFSVLLFKLLQAANSTPSNLWQLFTFPSGKLVGEGTARGRILGAERVNGGGEYRPRKCPTDGMPRKASVCGAATASPLPTTLFPVFP